MSETNLTSPAGEEAAQDEPAQPSKARDIVVVAVVALIALMLGVNLFVMFDDSESAARVGEQVPDFGWQSVSDDEPVELADFRGKVVVLDFWATWCTACEAQMPVLEKLAADEALGGQVEFVAVNVDADSEDRFEKVERFVLDRPLALTTVIDDGPAQSWFGIARLPTVVVIGPDGEVSEISEGVHDEDSLRAYIAAAGGQ